MVGKPIVFITSWGPGGWDLYAKRFVESFVEHFPAETRLLAYYHDSEFPRDAPLHSRVEYRTLDGCAALQTFKCKYAHVNGLNRGQYNFRYDAIKFCHKVFALKQAVTEECVGDEWLVWLDADTFAFKPIPLSFFEKTLSRGAFVWLDRTDIDYAETSFLAFDLSRGEVKAALSELFAAYEYEQIFGFKEWHDGYIISQIIKEYPEDSRVNLSEGCKGLEAFQQSPLAEYMEHLKGNRKHGPAPFRVKPVDVADKETILANVRTNSALIEKRVKHYLPHEGVAVIVGGGPTASEYVGEIQGRAQNGATVVAVKHSLPVLRRAHIEPHYCVVLDPRPIDGTSTHDVVRKELYDGYAGSVEFLVASMTHPSTVEHLRSLNANLRLWHAFTQTLAESRTLPAEEIMIAGGTCAALRAVGIMYTMGFRRFHFYGVDAGQGAEPTEAQKLQTVQGNPKWFRVGTDPDPDKGRKWWTTGELVALAQDVDELAGRQDLDANIEWHGESLAREMWDARGRRNLEDYTYGA